MVYGAILLLAALVQLTLSSFEGKLKFNSNGKFKIVQFTDLHYGPYQPLNDGTTEIQKTVILYEEPDFIAYTGDLSSSGESVYPGYIERMFNQCLSVPNSQKIPYGITLGNNDTEGYLKGEEIIELDLKNEYSMTKPSSTSSGSSNYVLPVYDNEGEYVKYLLWFLDSGNKSCMGLDTGWGCVEPEVVQWVYQTSKLYPNIPGIIFAHIPMQEFMTGFYDYDSYGNRQQNVSCPTLNTGLPATAISRNLKGIFVGHDHNNDYYIKYPMLELHYGRKTGLYYYGPKNLNRGGKVIQIDILGNFTTWIRDEDGNKERQQLITDKGDVQYKCA